MKLPSIALLGLALSICGCDRLSLDTYWRSERYVLLAVDSKSQMSLAFDCNDGTALGLVDQTVFSIGANDEYIVLKQHPANDDAAMSIDRSVTNYFVVERNSSSMFKERAKLVRGPMDQSGFNELAEHLPLPAFSKTFHDLE